jgi:D-3-phosphoglycerate dehydrogenase
MRRALVIDYAWPDLEIEREVLADAGIEVAAADTGLEAELLRLAADFDALMVNWLPLSGRVLRAATRCRTVARFGVGVDNIDVDTATRLGIPVTRVSSYCIDEVAEHTMALLLALRRRIVPFAAQTTAGGWDNTASGPLHRLRGSTFGVAGWGAIGRAVADLARGLGMKVEAWSRSTPPQGWPSDVRPASSLLELAGRVDHLSMHVPLTAETTGLVGEEVLRAMRPNAVLLNTARGAIVDTAALADAVRERRIAGAGIDVLDADPPAPGNPLIGLENVLVTPHAAFNSVEAIATLRRQAAVNVVTVLNGGRPRDIVNPEVFDSPALRGAGGEGIR